MLQFSTLKFLKDLKRIITSPGLMPHRKEYEYAKTDFTIFIQQ